MYVSIPNASVSGTIVDQRPKGNPAYEAETAQAGRTHGALLAV